jgi:serine/threonine protein kinase
VVLLGRLHHRNLVNLVGYSAEKGHRILVYEFMRNGSLEKLIYGKCVLSPLKFLYYKGSFWSDHSLIFGLIFSDHDREPLSWNLRVQIAQDVALGIEYLHDGVCKKHPSYILL